MAELAVENDELVLHLSGAEKAESLHRDMRVPLSAVSRIQVIDDAHEAADHPGFKAGTRLPGVVEVASIRTAEGKIFAAVHRATPRGVRVLLTGSSYDEWIVGCPDPEAVVAALKLPA
ncbi:MAG: hypothetical protein ACYCST_17250 [Acidimicrobiales bacterium]